MSWKTAANDPPSAVFTAAPTSVSVGDSVFFDARGSTDPNGPIATYGWELGDGTKATARTAQDRYKRAGSYTAHLTVTDDLGESHSTSRVITVTPAARRVATPTCLGRGATILAQAGQKTRGTSGRT